MSILTNRAAQALTQGRPSSLVAPVLSAPAAHLSSLLRADAIKPLDALLTASENPAGVELSGHATAIGFATFSSKEVEGTRNHGLGAQEMTQSCGQSRVGSADLLAQFGGLGVHTVLYINITHTDWQQKNDSKVKK